MRREYNKLWIIDVFDRFCCQRETKGVMAWILQFSLVMARNSLREGGIGEEW